MLEASANRHLRLLDLTAGERVVVVANTGGHLSQAMRWAERLRWSADSLFITFENEQSRSLLADRPHVFVPYIAPRDVRAGLRALAQLQRLDLGGFHAVVSTGAGIAAAALPHALRHGLPFLYLESMSRFAGPSLTGRVLEHVPWVHRFTQYAGYSARRWTRVEPLLADYVTSAPAAPPPRNRRVFVTLGTIAPYRFDRLVDAVAAQLRDGDEVVWQLGVTDRRGLPGRSEDYIPGDEFARLVAWADVVVTHAGIGTLLAVLDAGKLPVTMARLGRYGEHVDDHQVQARDRLVSLGLAVDLAEHSDDALELAARVGVTQATNADGREAAPARPTASSVVVHFGNRAGGEGGIAAVIRQHLRADQPELLPIAVTTYDQQAVGTFRRQLPALTAARAALRLPQPDGVAHVHLSRGASLVREGAILLLLRARRAPVVVTLHGSTLATLSGLPLVGLRHLLRAADRVHGFDERYRVRLRVPEQRWLRLPNAVDLPDPAGPRRPIAVFAGRVGLRKGVDLLLAAWHRMPEGSELHLYGGVDDGFHPLLPPGAILHGEQPHEEVLEALRTASVLVLPSRAEAFPMVVCEALAAGCAVVGTDVGALGALLRESGQVLTPPDAASLHAELAALLEDPARIAGLGDLGRAYAEEHLAAPVVAARWREVYSGLLSGVDRSQRQDGGKPTRKRLPARAVLTSDRRRPIDAEAALSDLFAAELDRGGLRTRLRHDPAATFRASLSALRLLLALPVVPVRLPHTSESRAVRRLLRAYPVDQALTLRVAAVLPVPDEPGAYLLGSERGTLRRKIRAAERQGVVVRAVPVGERHHLVSLADEHERTNERAAYRSATPRNEDLLDYGLWLAAYSSTGDPLVLAVIPHAGGWAVLRHFRTLVSSPAASDARYLLTARVVEALNERGVRHLVDPMPPRWLRNGLRHFQRMVGFRLIRLGAVRVVDEQRVLAPVEAMRVPR